MPEPAAAVPERAAAVVEAAVGGAACGGAAREAGRGGIDAGAGVAVSVDRVEHGGGFGWGMGLGAVAFRSVLMRCAVVTGLGGKRTSPVPPHERKSVV